MLKKYILYGIIIGDKLPPTMYWIIIGDELPPTMYQISVSIPQLIDLQFDCNR